MVSPELELVNTFKVIDHEVLRPGLQAI